MAAVNEQKAVAEEIADIISNPINGSAIDEVCILRSISVSALSHRLRQTELERELEELEQEALDDRLRGADHVPLHQPEIAKVSHTLDAIERQSGSNVVEHPSDRTERREIAKGYEMATPARTQEITR